MVDPKELEVEIARLEYAESSYPNYAKLADLYIIQDRQNRKKPDIPAYSSAPAPQSVSTYGNSEFLTEVNGKDLSGVFNVMDELMDTLRVVNPRAYNGVMRKIRAL